MKILFINLPYTGHVIPTIGLVQQLIQKGADVTYLMPYDWKESVLESGAEFHGYQNHKQLSEQIKYASTEADCIAQNYHLIVYEQFFFLGKHLAQKHGIPAVRIFTAPATNQRIMDAYLKSNGPLSVFRFKWLSKAFTKDIARNIPMKTDNWLDEIVYNPCDLNLVYVLKEFQPDIEDFPDEHFKFLGPSIYPRKQADFHIKKSDKPIIYISLGTIARGSYSFFQACIDAFSSENAEVIISTGRVLNTSKLKRMSKNIHLYSYVPQIEVLKQCSVFVTHGGMNSISEALVYGVPMVVIPMSSDQPVNAASVVKNGAGIMLPYQNVTSSSLKQAVFSLLNHSEIKQNLEKLQKSVQNSPGNEQGAQLILEFYDKSKASV